MVRRAQRVSSADVAARAGVSRTTVSFVLNRRTDAGIPPDTWRRVEEAARDLGYHPHGPARALAAGVTGTIGLVLRQSAEQVAADALLAEVLWGLGGEIRASGYRVLVEALPPTDGHYSDLLLAERVDGLILSGPRSDDEEIAALVADDFPIVVQGRLDAIPVASVDVDNHTGARDAVAHLVALGHRRIACVTNAPLAYTAAAERLAGYREALEAAGIAPDVHLVEEGAFDAASGRAAMSRVLARDPAITACFAASDVVAFGVLRALREAGRRVPADVSVVGFDDIALAQHFDPPLTTVRVPARMLGAVAGRVVVERLAGRIANGRTLLGTEFVVRESTAPPPSTGWAGQGTAASRSQPKQTSSRRKSS